MDLTVNQLEDAMSRIPSDLPHETWFSIAAAIKSAVGEGGRYLWDRFNQGGGKSKTEINGTWRGARAGFFNVGTIIHLAKEYGYELPNKKPTKEEKQRAAKERAERERLSRIEKLKQEEEDREAEANFKNDSAIILSLADSLLRDALYFDKKPLCSRKGVFTVDLSLLSDEIRRRHHLTLKEIPFFLPYYDVAGNVKGMQFTTSSLKLPLKGSKLSGAYGILGSCEHISTAKNIIIGEGYATVDAVIQAYPDHLGLVAGNAHNLKIVAKIARKNNPTANIYLLEDNDKSKIVSKIERGMTGQRACEVAANDNDCIVLKVDTVGTDFSDLLESEGLEAIKKAMIKTNSMINIVDDRYILDGLMRAIETDNKLIKLDSDMNTGKTYAIGQLIKKLEGDEEGGRVLFLSHLAAINTATATALTASTGIEITSYKEIDNSKRGLKYIASTFNSLEKIIPAFSHSGDLYIVIDETEGVAGYLANGTINTKSATSELLKDLVSIAKKVILSDAHMHKLTDLFILSKLGLDPASAFTVKNIHKPWSNCIYSINDTNDGGAGFALDFLKSNKKLSIPCTSATHAETLYEMITSAYPDKKVLLVTRATGRKKEVVDAKENPSLFGNYDCIIYSPAMGIGVSINNGGFYDSMPVFSRHHRTGDSRSAVQMPFRTRDTRRFHCFVVDNGSDSDNQKKDLRGIIDNYYYANLLENYLIDKANNGDDTAQTILLKSTAQQLLHYSARTNYIDMIDYYQFFDSIFGIFDKKGIERVEHDVSVVVDKSEIKEVRVMIKEKKKSHVLSARDVSANEFELLKMQESKESGSLCEEDYLSYLKANLKVNFVPSELISDQNIVNSDILDQAYDDNENGLIKKRSSIVLAMMRANQVKDIVGYYFFGLNGDAKKDEGEHKSLMLTTEYTFFSYVASIIGLTKTEKEGGNGEVIPVYSFDKSIIIDSNCIKNKAEFRRKARMFNSTTRKSGRGTIGLKHLNKNPQRLLVEFSRSVFGVDFEAVKAVSRCVVKRSRIKNRTIEPLLFDFFSDKIGFDSSNLMRSRQVIVDASLLSGIDSIVDDFNIGRKKGRITKGQLSNPIKLARRLLLMVGLKPELVTPSPSYTIKSEQRVIDNLNVIASKGIYGVHGLHDRIKNISTIGSFKKETCNESACKSKFIVTDDYSDYYIPDFVDNIENDSGVLAEYLS